MPPPRTHPRSRVRAARRGAGGRTLACVAALLVIAAGPAATAPLVVADDPVGNGLFDPSIAVDPVTGTAWLVYSRVSGTSQPWGPLVETHLAHSDDAGASWRFDAKLVASTAGTIELAGVTTPGWWNAEVPSIAYDPTDPVAPWKLIFHRIFRRDPVPSGEDGNAASHSWLEVHEAAAPTGPWTLVTRLGSGLLPPPEHPIDQALNPLDASLAGTLVYSEPGLLAANGRLYLCVSALSPEPPDAFVADVVLLASDDHGATWTWLGPLLTTDDAAALGYEDFDGAALVEQAGRVFVLASPGTPTQTRLGTEVYAVLDLEPPTLLEVGGAPLALETIPLATLGGIAFGGQATWHEAAATGGILMNQLDVTAGPALFTVEETGRTPLPEPAGGLGLVVGILAATGSRSRARLG